MTSRRVIVVEEGYWITCPDSGKVLEVRSPTPGREGRAVLDVDGVIYATAAHLAEQERIAAEATAPASPVRRRKRRRARA